MIRALAIISKACNLTYESTDYILGTFGSQCRAGNHYWIKIANHIDLSNKCNQRITHLKRKSVKEIK